LWKIKSFFYKTKVNSINKIADNYRDAKYLKSRVRTDNWF